MAKTILIAEDCANLTDFLGVLLERVDFAVTWATDGKECIDIALTQFEKGKSFDLVIVDIRMPRLNGFEVARQLRAAGFDGPILAMTAVPSIEGEEESVLSGINAYFSKEALSIPWFENILKTPSNKACSNK